MSGFFKPGLVTHVHFAAQCAELGSADSISKLASRSPSCSAAVKLLPSSHAEALAAADVDGSVLCRPCSTEQTSSYLSLCQAHRHLAGHDVNETVLCRPYSTVQATSCTASCQRTPWSEHHMAPESSCALQALQHRADNKLYRILSPQTPVARTRLYDRHAMDEFPNGTNMMVAVLAYTCAPCFTCQLRAVSCRVLMQLYGPAAGCAKSQCLPACLVQFVVTQHSGLCNLQLYLCHAETFSASLDRFSIT